jgi:hypothetical protein
MASAAEARIRDKAERMLRDLFPDARIVHEFDLCGVRLDLAAITPERLVLLEIKSENDTLARLDNQARFSLRIGGPFIVCVAPRWQDDLTGRGANDYSWYRAERLVETADGFADIHNREGRYQDYWRTRLTEAHRDSYDSRALMSLLLKPELYALAKPHGARSKHDVAALQNITHEHLTGRQIRRGVLAALRARRFGWTCDAPVSAEALA